MSPLGKRTTERYLNCVVTSVAVSAAGWMNAAVSGPITFNAALGLAEGEFVLREQLVVNQSGDDPSGADRDRTSQTVVSVLGYGVNSNLVVFGVLPYLDNELQITTGGQRVTRSTSGLGDLTMLGRYTVVRPADAHGKAHHADLVQPERIDAQLQHRHCRTGAE